VNILWPLLAVAAIVVVWLASDRMSKARAADELRVFEQWKTLPTDERLLAHTNWVERKTQLWAVERRNTWTFIAIVVAGGALLFAGLQDNTDSVGRQAVAVESQARRNCTYFRRLVQVLNDFTDRDIRAMQARRNELADRLSHEEPTLEDIPGYDQLGPAVQRFVLGIVDASAEESAAEIVTLDEDLARIRRNEDTLSSFALELNCPD